MNVHVRLLPLLSDRAKETGRVAADDLFLAVDHHLRRVLSLELPQECITSDELIASGSLSSLSQGTNVPLSEAEMALRWWTVADGEKDEAYIDRARLLRSLALQVIARASRLETSGHPASAIHALVKSETLRELGIDRVKFRHDVLREWAAANLLFSEREIVDQLPFQDAPPPDLARAAELMARMAIERSDHRVE